MTREKSPKLPRDTAPGDSDRLICHSDPRKHAGVENWYRMLVIRSGGDCDEELVSNRDLPYLKFVMFNGDVRYGVRTGAARYPASDSACQKIAIYESARPHCDQAHKEYRFEPEAAAAMFNLHMPSSKTFTRHDGNAA